MHPRYQELSAHLDQQRAELRASVAAVPVRFHRTAPADGAWSVVDVLEHLVIVDGRISALLEKQINEAKSAGVEVDDETSPILPQLNIARFTDRSRKIKGPDALTPKSGPPLDGLWQSLDASLAAIKLTLATADGMKLSGLMMPHPAFGPLDLYTWFAFFGSHEARHAAQIREIGAVLAASE